MNEQLIRPGARVRTGSSLLWLVVALAVVFAGMRVVGVLGPPKWRFLLPFSFVLMAATPWLVLDKCERAESGLVGSTRTASYPLALAFGALAAVACFLLGVVLFGTSEDNWFISVASSYRRAVNTAGISTLMLYLTFTLPAVLFSPLGEEIFFRGLLQRALEMRLSVKASTACECVAFGLVHLCHHGLYWNQAGLRVHLVSGALWVLLMTAVAWGFATIRKTSGSVAPAIAAHAAFNVAMNATVFSALWR
jgi:membrane protease YdiL (CAAX protease family)